MGAIRRRSKQYAVEYEMDKENRFRYNRETDDYGGTNVWDISGGFSSIKSAMAAISKTRKEYAAMNPRNFRILDIWDDSSEYPPCVCIVE